MATEEYLDSIAESITHARWIVDHHVGKGEGRQRCVLCETWWPCDLVSLAATAVLLSDRMTGGKQPPSPVTHAADCQCGDPNARHFTD